MESGTTPSFPVLVPLPSGDELVVRRLAVDDVDAIVELYAGLGSRDRHRRFFSQSPARREWVVAWIERCRDHGDGIVAVAPCGRVVGEAAYVLRPNGDGEFSLTVDADWRGWLGPFLLDLLVQVAAANGVPNLEADVLTENVPMQALVRRRNAVLSGESDMSVQHVVLGTAVRQATWPPVRDGGAGPRVLVEAPGGRWSAAADATRAGFDVLGCAGPDRRTAVPCPMRDGRPCPLAAGADVIVVAVPPETELGAWLVESHSKLHPTVPVLVVGGGSRLTGGAAVPAGPVCRLAAGTPSAVLVDELERLAVDRARQDLRPSRGVQPPAQPDEETGTHSG